MELIENLDRLQESMVVTRKVLRFGMPLPLLRSVLNRLSGGDKERCPFWRTVSEVCRLIYYLLDHPLYLKRIGVLTLSPKVTGLLEWRKNVLRIASIVIGIFLDIVELHHIQKQIKALVRLALLPDIKSDQTQILSRSKADMDSRS